MTKIEIHGITYAVAKNLTGSKRCDNCDLSDECERDDDRFCSDFEDAVLIEVKW